MKNKVLYLFEAILLAFIFILKFVFINKYPNLYEIVNVVFWIGSFLVLYKVLGLRKDISVCKTNTIQIVIISILIFVLSTYLSGLYFGFLRNSYSLTLVGILKNIYSVTIMIVLEECIRSMVAKKCIRDAKPLIVLTILYILLDIVLAYNASSINSMYKLFVFICSTCLTSASRNILCSYLTYHVSYIPSLLVRLFFTLYVFIFPILPDLGDYINSVIGIAYPYLIYLLISGLVASAEHKKPSPIKKKLWYVNIPLAVFLAVVVILVSGIFRYQIMAIGSGSMEPIIYRGDAVIFDKWEKLDDISVGEVIVFKHANQYITHRVVKVDKDGERLSFKTKGDNNNDEDLFTVYDTDVVGVTKLNIKWIGMPSIWFQDLIS